ncbi:helix-turn-helix domain-containing protein [Ureibacillus chungkukjangi]|uniref:MerR family transcriptional regulator n=1 Tax=Ureibacillus chungkukjangi TaxID=1202712 RepID=A0A318TQE9_9BACL|nr:helix-turn-helix transcriptional regulator [Ureibacillus chungkukjangi]MCM3388172.1 helix-turn-helix domain-containing protein [Ureibacillus chungkukjangi]MDI7743983.1 helix-turn-helix transcriptional regulator [Lysinibacillus fusiformis]PYF01869.1 MerR family transcriptional regulator [Ureibacillus chungkukjangi]
MDNLVKLVGLNIKEIRKIKKMTQEELAEKSGLQTSYLAGVERGDRNITLQTLEKIVLGLEVSPSYIFNFERLDTNERHFEKEELSLLLFNLIENKNEGEIRLLLNIGKEIFSTYGHK